MEAFVSQHSEETDGWEELLRSACDTLDRLPEAVMNSISVMGRLNGMDGEALLVVSMSDQLAAEYGVREAVEIEGNRFTVRFWRRDSE